MIYSDDGAKDDSPSCPGNRDGLCLNCNKIWSDHYGWACAGNSKYFDQSPPNKRFLTESMRDSITTGMTKCPFCKKYKCGTIDCG